MLQPPKYHICSMKKACLKPQMKCVILFTIDDLYDGDGRKTLKYTKKNEYENKGKNSPFGCSPILLSTKMEADCFPVSENTKNKPDLP